MKYCVILTLVLLAVLLGISRGQEQNGQALARVAAVLQEDTNLRSALMEQLREYHSAEALRQQKLTELQDLCSATSSLQQEVLRLEAAASAQEELVTDAASEDAAAIRTLQDHLTTAVGRRTDAFSRAQESGKKFCAALTEGRCKLRQLCRNFPLEGNEDMITLLFWLTKNNCSSSRCGSMWPKEFAVMAKLLVLWVAWPAMLKGLLAAVSILWGLKFMQSRPQGLKEE